MSSNTNTNNDDEFISENKRLWFAQEIIMLADHPGFVWFNHVILEGLVELSGMFIKVLI
jgi:hypothetical protein